MGLRKATTNTEILKIDNGNFLGLRLGADATSEHEWGIAKLRSDFGVPDMGVGIERRTITTVPDSLRLETVGNGMFLFYSRHGYMPEDWADMDDEERVKTLKYMEIYPDRKHFLRHDNPDFQTSWYESGFVAYTETGQGKELLKALYKAFQNRDIAMWVGGGMFIGGGLTLVIRSRLPQEIVDEFQEADEDKIRLEEAAAATGIEETLRIASMLDAEERGCESYRADFQYFALSPRWLKDMNWGEKKTDHPVVFWLNPMQQDRNNFGWFTVEELEAWTRGEGPIPREVRDARMARSDAR